MAYFPISGEWGMYVDDGTEQTKWGRSTEEGIESEIPTELVDINGPDGYPAIIIDKGSKPSFTLTLIEFTESELSFANPNFVKDGANIQLLARQIDRLLYAKKIVFKLENPTGNELFDEIIVHKAINRENVKHSLRYDDVARLPLKVEAQPVVENGKKVLITLKKNGVVVL